MAIVFPCHVCRTSLSAEERYAGQLVRCPTCQTATKVPAASVETLPVAVAAGGSSSGGMAPP